MYNLSLDLGDVHADVTKHFPSLSDLFHCGSPSRRRPSELGTKEENHSELARKTWGGKRARTEPSYRMRKTAQPKSSDRLIHVCRQPWRHVNVCGCPAMGEVGRSKCIKFGIGGHYLCRVFCIFVTNVLTKFLYIYIYIDSLCRRKESKCKIHGNVVLVTARVRLVVKMFSFAALGCPTVGGALEEAFRTFLVETTETTSQKRHSNWLVHCSSMFQQCAPRTSSE